MDQLNVPGVRTELSLGEHLVLKLLARLGNYSIKNDKVGAFLAVADAGDSVLVRDVDGRQMVYRRARADSVYHGLAVHLAESHVVVCKPFLLVFASASAMLAFVVEGDVHAVYCAVV